MKDFKIGNHSIGQAHKPFIIAEMSGNHNQSLERALEIVDAAAASGAQMLKLQTYTSDTMTLDMKSGEFFIKMRKASGKEITFLIYTRSPIPLGSGTSRSCSGPRSWGCFVSVLRLTIAQSIF